jgi:hypothetical protein
MAGIGVWIARPGLYLSPSCRWNLGDKIDRCNIDEDPDAGSLDAIGAGGSSIEESSILK